MKQLIGQDSGGSPSSQDAEAAFKENFAWGSPAQARRIYFEKSRATAVKVMCRQCVGGVMADVKGCLDSGCPLWTFRPYATPEDRATPPWMLDAQRMGVLDKEEVD